MKTKHYLTIIAAGLLAGSLGADVIRLYDYTESPAEIGFTNIKGGTNEGVTWGAQIAALEPDAVDAMGVPGAFRIWSYESASYSRADAVIILAEGLTGGFRISYKAYNQNYFWIDSSFRKVAVRGANPGVAWDAINSSSQNYQNMVEMYADGTVGGAWNRVDGVGEPRFVTDPGAGTAQPVPLSAHTFDLIVNASPTETFTYVLHGIQRTMDPTRYDLFIDGVLVTPAANPAGSAYETKSNFDPVLGFGGISFTTATSSHAETDFVLDQAYIYTGDDVSEGEVMDNPIQIVLGDSMSIGAGFYVNDVLGLLWSDGAISWIHNGMGWLHVQQADATAYLVYDAQGSQWLYFPTISGGWYYNYNSGQWES